MTLNRYSIKILPTWPNVFIPISTKCRCAKTARVSTRQTTCFCIYLSSYLNICVSAVRNAYESFAFSDSLVMSHYSSQISISASGQHKLKMIDTTAYAMNSFKYLFYSILNLEHGQFRIEHYGKAALFGCSAWRYFRCSKFAHVIGD